MRGYRIPKGTLVLWSAYLSGRDPSAWTDPLRFDPDRFVDLTDEQRTIADHAWVPFGRGARNCIGFALAQMELTLIISRLAQRLDVHPTQPEMPRPVGMVVNRPSGGTPMHVTPRHGIGSYRSAVVRRSVFRLRVIAAAAAAMTRVLVRRPLRGPAQPTWTWSEELFVAASRAALTTSGWDVELMSPSPRGLKPPLGRQISRALTVADVDLGGVRAERYCPTTPPSGTILRFHGGGFVSGSARLERRVAAELAVLSNCDTFGISYRLAPEHPYPAALDDAVAAYRGSARARR